MHVDEIMTKVYSRYVLIREGSTAEAERKINAYAEQNYQLMEPMKIDDLGCWIGTMVKEIQEVL